MPLVLGDCSTAGGSPMCSRLLLAAGVYDAPAAFSAKASLLGGHMFYDEEYENEGKCSCDTMEQDATATLWRWTILITAIAGALA